MSNGANLGAPHRPIRAADARERFAIELLDTLWTRYRKRVVHVRSYERLLAAAGGSFVNDHIAFRCFAAQEPQLGIQRISRLFEALGYCAAACYRFPDKKLDSIHYRHPNPGFPKIFISELKTWELPARARGILRRLLRGHRPPMPDAFLTGLREAGRASPGARKRLLDRAAAYFETLPWERPEKRDVLALDKDSQFAAWTAVHGYDVNHFTISINSHGVPALDDIDKTVAALKRAGVPMKDEIEGAPGSKLRQSATEAAVIEVPVRVNGRPASMPWTYAYFELAERGLVVDPDTGRRTRFEGFLGPQAANLFEMTRLGGAAKAGRSH